jgi:putative phage-type endonuclease
MIPHGTEEWHSARAGRWTASMAPDLMARRKDGTPMKKAMDAVLKIAWERVAGQPCESFTTYAMRRGNELEDQAIAAYEAETLSSVSPGGLVLHPTIDSVAATPDSLVGDDGLLETKCPDSEVKFITYLTDEQSLPDEYKWQVHFQLWVTGRKWCDLVAYDPRMVPKHQLVVRRIERCADKIAEIESAVSAGEVLVEAIITNIGKAAA